MKICKVCKIEKPLDSYHKDKSCKYGCKNRCKMCDKLNNIKNKEKIVEYGKKYREINKTHIIEKNKKWNKDNPEKVKAITKKWAKANPEKVKAYFKKYIKERRLIDPLFKLRTNTSSLIYHSIKNNGYTKKTKTAEILGCTYEFYLKHIESKWLLPQNLDENGQVWMNWDNHGLYNGELNFGWDIDHRIPISSAENEEELLKLFHYSNQQPLCSKVNRDIKKSNLIV